MRRRDVRSVLGIAIGLAALLFDSMAFARTTAVKDVRLSASSETTRIVFDLSQTTSEQVFVLHSPERVVIDFTDARLDLSSGSWPNAAGLVKEFRWADRGNGVLRIVLEAAQLIEAHNFTVEPSGELGHRLVVDLSLPGKYVASAPPQVAPVAPQPIKALPKDSAGRELIIAIDAGHGGQDPGASGRKGTREKDVTLAIAQKLKERIDAEPGMRAVLTRDGDYFVPLRERIVRARKQQADLFISIHADSVHDRDIGGSSVYVLSAGRASNEAARMLADRENAADLMGGMTLENKDEVLASVLLDLSQGASMSASAAAADKVLNQLARVSPILDSEIKHASLKVLTSPDMPSMLVETAFISNPREELKLKDARHQSRLADAILAGVRTYFYDNPPPGTRVAQRVAQQRTYVSPGGILAGSIAQ